ncbi:MAG: Crp/Fnr family transcriptional regulator [Chloroflexi bacterium]|nr:Crp/Fnr family transcriptional regulator [Chloroflexota bacterium]
MPDFSELIAQLQRVEHFKNLPEADIRAIVTAGRVRQFTAGETIFMEGAPCAGMFVLLRGRVHLRKLGPSGQESIMAVIEPVIMFNEVAVLDGGPNLATAVTAQDSLAWQIGCESFQALLGRYPQMGLGLLRVLARRNRFLVSQYEDLSFRSVQARAAKLLLELSLGGQQPIDRRKHPSHEMAARIATVPEAFSRALNAFKRSGCLTCTRTTIIVHCVDDLAVLAEHRAVVLKE